VRTFAPAVVAFALLAGGVDAAPGVAVSDAWSRPAIGTGVVYLRIVNRGTAADRLDAARTPVARVVEVHRSIERDGTMNGMTMHGVMTMERVPVLPVPAHGSLTLAPGGYHLMAIGLRRDLQAGERFPLRLHFASAGWTTVTVAVRPI
jgi:copper(I)-binding protein